MHFIGKGSAAPSSVQRCVVLGAALRRVCECVGPTCAPRDAAALPFSAENSEKPVLYAFFVIAKHVNIQTKKMNSKRIYSRSGILPLVSS
jgi:hypothetical protein